jgi:hypothetical protein
MYMVDSLTKKYASKYVKESKIGVMMRSLSCPAGVLNKDPTLWLNGAQPPPKFVITQYYNTFGGLANTPKVDA